MPKIYRIEDGRAVRERQGRVTGRIVDVWRDVFEITAYWIAEETKALLDGMGSPLVASVAVEEALVPIFYPDEPRDPGTLPPETSLRSRALAGHGIAVCWWGWSGDRGRRPAPEPQSPEDPYFFLKRIGSAASHTWRLFRTKEEARECARRYFATDPAARAWADGIPFLSYQDLVLRSPGTAR